MNAILKRCKKNQGSIFFFLIFFFLLIKLPSGNYWFFFFAELLVIRMQFRPVYLRNTLAPGAFTTLAPPAPAGPGVCPKYGWCLK